ncbi:hypothetical protein A9Z42_0027760 [Trichoderma parareesei]|uniref:Uncharacterized protein n=1 Tax=Trichoderma parareesei TaxID=858221 RepID=A0A2H2ZJT5_TRIPA|nr:hypothetical protein A9Z42_0027760 [Trichoderma parareesei]
MAISQTESVSIVPPTFFGLTGGHIDPFETPLLDLEDPWDRLWKDKGEMRGQKKKMKKTDMEKEKEKEKEKEEKETKRNWMMPTKHVFVI